MIDSANDLSREEKETASAREKEREKERDSIMAIRAINRNWQRESEDVSSTLQPIFHRFRCFRNVLRESERWKK